MAKNHSLNILIADDSKTICNFIEGALKNMPLRHNFVKVHDGDRCLKLLKSARCDIAFVDINMPGMSGLEALKISRSHGGEAFVIMMSADVDDQKRQIARDSGAYEYLRKPINPEDLVEIINNYIRFQTLAKVLVVDESGTVRQLVKRILADSVFKMHVREAGDVHETVVECQNNPPDILFMDIKNKGDEAVSILKTLTEMEISPKTILMTGDKDMDFDPNILSYGVVDLLYKPFYSEDVDRVVHKIFKLRPTSLQFMEKAITLQLGEVVDK